MKKLLSILVCLLVVFTLASCKKSNLKQIAIIQFVSDPALDNARIGIIEGLEKEGFVDGKNCKIKIYNPQTKSDTLSLMAETAVSESDMVICIATPVVVSVVKEIEKQGSDIPVLFTAVTDPSTFVTNLEQPEKNITGTSDINPVAEQIKGLKMLDPNFSTLGFLYTATESNSIYQKNLASAACLEEGITLVDMPVSKAADIELVLSSSIDDCDAVYIPTDNIVASSMNLVSRVCGESKKATICGEVNQLTDGGILSIGSVDYKLLGVTTGEMAGRILNGSKVSEVPVSFQTNTSIVVNKTKADEYGITIPQTLLDKAEVR